MFHSLIATCFWTAGLLLPTDGAAGHGAATHGPPAEHVMAWLYLNQLSTSGGPSYVVNHPFVFYRESPNAARLGVWSQVLGASLSEVDEPLRVHLGLETGDGVLVTGVGADGAAARARLQPHDVILGLPAKIDVNSPQPMELLALRKGQRIRLALDAAQPKQFWIGVNTNVIEEAMRVQLSLPAGRGLLITDVVDKSPAQRAGFLRYDVIAGLGDGSAIGSTEDLAKIVKDSGGKTLQFQVLRHAKAMTIGVTPVERPRDEKAAQGADQAMGHLYLKPGDAPGVLNWVVRLQPQLQADHLTMQPWLLAMPKADPACKVEALHHKVEELLKEVAALHDAIQKQSKSAADPKEE